VKDRLNVIFAGLLLLKKGICGVITRFILMKNLSSAQFAPIDVVVVTHSMVTCESIQVSHPLSHVTTVINRANRSRRVIWDYKNYWFGDTGKIEGRVMAKRLWIPPKTQKNPEKRKN